MKYLNAHDVPFMFDPYSYRIFMLIGDQWVEIVDGDIKNKVRFQATEITRRDLISLMNPDPRDLIPEHPKGMRSQPHKLN